MSRKTGSPLLSVLLPCRDAAHTLDDCIESLRAQTLTEFEVIAVDDGSRDRSAGRLTAWAEEDERVRVVEIDRQGIVDALEAARRHANAPFLLRMDADDIAHPDRFTLQHRFLDGNPDIAACGTGVRYFPRESVGSGYRRYERWLNSLHEPHELERDLFVECPIAHPSLAVRASALDEVGGYRKNPWPEDYDLLLRLDEAGHRLANLPQTLLRWRLTGDRASARSSTYDAAAFRRCKVHHLLRGRLPTDRDPVVWGAGSVGKALARELIRRQVQPAAFVDLDPRKLGQTIHGAEVLPPDGILDGFPRRPYVLVAVGSPGAREDIRRHLDGWRFVEGVDYRTLA